MKSNKQDGANTNDAGMWEAALGAGGVSVVQEEAVRKAHLHPQMQVALVEVRAIELAECLAGGMAHDFNNMLTPILGYAELLSRQLPSDDPNRILLEPILLAAQRCRDLVWQLLAFARKQTLEMKPRSRFPNWRSRRPARTRS